MPTGTFPAANLDELTMPLAKISTAPSDWTFPFSEYHPGLPLSPFSPLKTPPINVIRAHLAEFGIVAPVGRKGVEELLDVIADRSDKRVPEIARTCLIALGAQLRSLKAQILEFDRIIMVSLAGRWMR